MQSKSAFVNSLLCNSAFNVCTKHNCSRCFSWYNCPVKSDLPEDFCILKNDTLPGLHFLRAFILPKAIKYLQNPIIPRLHWFISNSYCKMIRVKLKCGFDTENAQYVHHRTNLLSRFIYPPMKATSPPHQTQKGGIMNIQHSVIYNYQSH